MKIRSYIDKNIMDEIQMIIHVEDKRNNKKYTTNELLLELISTYKKVNNYPPDMSEENVKRFMKMRENIIVNKK